MKKLLTLLLLVPLLGAAQKQFVPDLSLSYQVNPPGDQVRKPNGPLSQLFDGITTEYPQPGYGNNILPQDEYWIVLNGAIKITSIQLFALNGTSASDWSISAWYNGKETKLADFYGSNKGWMAFNVPAQATKLHIVTQFQKSVWPTEMKIFVSSDKTKPIKYAAAPHLFFNYQTGTNSFPWSFQQSSSPDKSIPGVYNDFKAFNNIRLYIDAKYLEQKQGINTFNPSHSGGWFLDNLLDSLKKNDYVLLFDYKCQPDWMAATWPTNNNQQWPVIYGQDPAKQVSYAPWVRNVYQLVCRYGRKVHPLSDLTIDQSNRWTGDPANKPLTGLDLLKFVENNNENDRWWQGRTAYQTPAEFAVNQIAFYNAVKSADTSMKVVIGGLCETVPDYLNGVIDYCNTNKIKIPFDVINYHAYTGTKQPEGTLDSILPRLVKIARRLKKPFWFTETGYDIYKGSDMAAPNEVFRAQWSLRTCLLTARWGVSRSFFYNDYDLGQNNVAYQTSGILNRATVTHRQPAGDYLYQVRQVMGSYKFTATVRIGALIQDKYVNNKGKVCYVMFSPTSTGYAGTWTTTLKGNYMVPQIGAIAMKNNVINGVIPITECPTFIFVK